MVRIHVNGAIFIIRPSDDISEDIAMSDLSFPPFTGDEWTLGSVKKREFIDLHLPSGKITSYEVRYYGEKVTMYNKP